MQDAKKLLEKYKNNECQPEELELLHRWLHNLHLNNISDLTEEDLLSAQSEFKSKFDSENPIKRKSVFWPKIASAAAVLILSFGLIFYFKYKNNEPKPLNASAKTPEQVLPGGNAAILTLEDGSKINLENESQEKLLNNQLISMNKDGELVYAANNESSRTVTSFHKIETPLKGQYKIVLSDGSKVWINSLSSLKFPTQFEANKRVVELTGEAYFEIQKDASKPFYVKSKNQVIKVLGTHFNLKSYPDESTEKTTLMEGAVKVFYQNNESKETSKILKPGEQTILKNGICFIHPVDLDQVVDWKNGDFIFKEESLGHIMKRVSRWYGIEVAFDNDVNTQQTFSGQVSRNKNLSEVIACLSATGGIDFKYANNKLYISNNQIINQN